MFSLPHQRVVALPTAPRVIGMRREVFASQGWRLLTSTERNWQIELTEDGRHPSETWAEIQRTLTLLAKTDRVRPLIIDLRGRPRLDLATREGMSTLLSRYEGMRVRVALICDVDVVQAVRLHSLLGHHAPTRGRRVLSLAQAMEWVRLPLPAIPAPLRPAA